MDNSDLWPAAHPQIHQPSAPSADTYFNFQSHFIHIGNCALCQLFAQFGAPLLGVLANGVQQWFQIYAYTLDIVVRWQLLQFVHDICIKCKFLVKLHKWHTTIHIFFTNCFLIKCPQIVVFAKSVKEDERRKSLEKNERLQVKGVE